MHQLYNQNAVTGVVADQLYQSIFSTPRLIRAPTWDRKVYGSHVTTQGNAPASRSIF